MYKLLEINGVSLPDPEGSYSLSRKDKFNEYEGENGDKTIEVIREEILSCSVSYSGLEQKKIKEIMDAISLVSTVKVYDPKIGNVKGITAKITDVKTDKKFHKNGISVWSLSFKIEQL